VKRDLKYIEVARTLAMATVVLAHVNDFSYLQHSHHTWWSITISVLVCFTVPMFFIVSGFLLGRKPRKEGERQPLRTFFLHKTGTIIVPFLIWNCIYMLIFRYIYHQPIFSLQTGWFMVTGYLQLYYVFVLLQFFLLFQLVAHRLNDRVLGRLVIAGLVISTLFYTLSDALLWKQGADDHFFEWHYGKAFIGWTIFFVWGLWLGRGPERMAWLGGRYRFLGLATVLSFALYYAETQLQVSIFGQNARQYFLLTGLVFQFTCANFVLAALYQISRLKTAHTALFRWLADSGADTFGIYLAHNALLILLLVGWEKSGASGIAIIKIPLLFVITWWLSQLLVRITRKPALAPLHRLLFGARIKKG
jgi:fucose 4-O-acetylase-like acetyltransferase